MKHCKKCNIDVNTEGHVCPICNDVLVEKNACLQGITLVTTNADYIELYNGSRLTCKLDALYLSDDIEDLKKIIKEKEVDKLVLGLPKNMNGAIGERGEYILKFKELLESELGYDVVLEDERLTTKVAENILINADMSRKKRKKVIDKMAATVILQAYLDRL